MAVLLEDRKPSSAYAAPKPQASAPATAILLEVPPAFHRRREKVVHSLPLVYDYARTAKHILADSCAHGDDQVVSRRSPQVLGPKRGATHC